MGSNSFILYLLTISLILAFCFAATAEDSSKSAVMAFNLGSKLFEEGKYVEAATEFRKAYSLRPNWKLFYNIGQSDAAAKRYGMALEAFNSYLAMAGDNIPEERRDSVLREIDRLQRMVCDIEIFGAPDGAVVSVDGVIRGKTPLPGPIVISSGVEHSLQVTNNETVILDKKVKLPSGRNRAFRIDEASTEENVVSHEDSSKKKQTSISVEEDAASAKRNDGPAKPLPNNNTSKKLKIGGVVFLSVAAGALVAGGITTANAIRLKNDLSPYCEPNGCPAEYESDNSRLTRLKRASIVLLGSGTAMLITGIVLLVAAKKKKKHATVALTPLMGAGHAGAIFFGEF